MKQPVLRRVRELAAGVAGQDVAALTRDTRLYVDLALDSAGALELIVKLEDAFDIQIHNEDTDGLETLADVAALMQRLIAERRRPGPTARPPQRHRPS